MADDTAVIKQELANISGQLAEMQATMVMWMDFQNELFSRQEKKTSASPSRSASLPYGSPPWNPPSRAGRSHPGRP